MVASKELRKYLRENNFHIIDENLSKEGDKFYEIILSRKSKDDLSKDPLEKEKYYEISEKLIEDKNILLREFVENKITLAESVMRALEDKESKKSKERYDELSELVDDYMEVLRRVEA